MIIKRNSIFPLVGRKTVAWSAGTCVVPALARVAKLWEAAQRLKTAKLMYPQKPATQLRTAMAVARKTVPAIGPKKAVPLLAALAS